MPAAGVMQPPDCLAGRPRPFVIAHRGASDLAPENTRSAFALALEAGSDVLETDLWLSSDGVPVCHHDATAWRMCGDPRRIDAMSASEVAALRVKASTDGIPALEDMLAWTPADVLVALELKDPRFADPLWAERLVSRLAERIAARTVLVIGFNLSWLRAIKSVAPALAIGHISLLRPFPPRGVDLLGPWWPWVVYTPWYLHLARRRGQWVCPLDPQLHKRLPRYLELGVDAVLTNDPARTRRVIASLIGTAQR